jgi:futalosine hydrolase
MAAPKDATAGGSPTLLLIPTEIERRRFLDQGGLPPGIAVLECCGFGPVAAAARTAELLARLHPARALLVGIAGAYDVERHPLGSALEPAHVALEGVGVGQGRELIAPPELGFPQWPGSDDAECGTHAIYDRLELDAGPNAEGLLLTTCAASADAAQAALRRERFPDAVAEDMEGFAVATACALAGVPLRIVRGISNEVGDRDPEHWRIPTALAAARRAALEVLDA